MRFFRRNDGVLQIERRANARLLADCPALLKLPCGERVGRLLDVSVGGSCLELPDPPRAGLAGTLEWMFYRSPCRVAWYSDDACGLVFEEPIPLSIVTETSHRASELKRHRVILENKQF